MLGGPPFSVTFFCFLALLTPDTPQSEAASIFLLLLLFKLHPRLVAVPTPVAVLFTLVRLWTLVFIGCFTFIFVCARLRFLLLLQCCEVMGMKCHILHRCSYVCNIAQLPLLPR